MSKELEALKRLRECLEYGDDELGDVHYSEHIEDLDIIETALKEYNDFQIVFKLSNRNEGKEVYDKLKALEIIKEKRVNVANFIYWLNKEPRTYEQYLNDYYQEGWHLHFRDNNDDRCKLCKLSLTEFNVLLEVFL